MINRIPCTVQTMDLLIWIVLTMDLLIRTVFSARDILTWIVLTMDLLIRIVFSARELPIGTVK